LEALNRGQAGVGLFAELFFLELLWVFWVLG
jgi:hypothetical protein